jgi:hypothetical protein
MHATTSQNSEKTQVAGYSANGSVALRNLLVNARSIMERELKSFLNSCLMKAIGEDDPTSANSQSRQNGSKNASGKRRESGIFSLGIIDKGGPGHANDGSQWMSSSTSSRRSSVHYLKVCK